MLSYQRDSSRTLKWSTVFGSFICTPILYVLFYYGKGNTVARYRSPTVVALVKIFLYVFLYNYGVFLRTRNLNTGSGLSIALLSCVGCWPVSGPLPLFLFLWGLLGGEACLLGIGGRSTSCARYRAGWVSWLCFPPLQHPVGNYPVGNSGFSV